MKVTVLSGDAVTAVDDNDGDDIVDFSDNMDKCNNNKSSKDIKQTNI